MDNNEQIIQLQKEVAELRQEITRLRLVVDLNPDIIQSISAALFTASTESVTDYDKDVDEGSTGTYTVAKVYDGMLKINNKVIGYYNQV